MDKMAIVTDGSLPSFPTDLGAVRPDAVVPFMVAYVDSVSGRLVEVSQSEISVEKFLDIQATVEKPPETKLPAPGAFFAVYVELAKAGFTKILTLTIPRTMSGTYDSALLAIETFHVDYPDVEVVVFDSGTTACGVEYMTELAIKERAADVSLSQIFAELEELRPKIEFLVALDTVRYLSLSGRSKELSADQVEETFRKHLKGVALQGALKLAKLGEKFAHRSPKVGVRFREGQLGIIKGSTHFSPVVDKLVADIHEMVDQGARLRRVYVLQASAHEERDNAVNNLRGFYNGEIVLRDELPVALHAIAGPKVLAIFCIWE